MSSRRHVQARRALVVAVAVAAAWTGVLLLTGGFVVHLGPLTISSRNPRGPMWIAAIAALAAWALPAPQGRGRALGEVLRPWWQAGLSLVERWPWIRRAEPPTLVLAAGIVTYVALWLDARPLWLDEEMIALNLRDRRLADLGGALWLGQSAPLGWLAVQRLAVLAFGTGELSLRLVPLLFGLGMLAVAAWTGRRWMTTAGATVFVLLCAIGRWLTHYPFEVKHYSADTFWGLLLPVMAAWSLEARDARHATRRGAAWWTAAAAGHWLANGALLATPACAAVIFVARWSRDGWRSAMIFASFGVAWLASFGLHFTASIRHTLDSEFLRSYWVGGLPPESAGVAEMLAWLAARFEPLALNPGGTELWTWLWALAACGFVLSPQRWLGVLFAAMPLSAFALGGLAVVPLLDRLALWMVPSLYGGVALFVDAAAGQGREAWTRRAWGRVALAAALVLLAIPLCLDIVGRGKVELAIGRPLEHKQGLDDRGAIAWLLRQRQPGDAFVTTRLALPAIWWFGAIPLADGSAPGSRHADGGPIFEAGFAPTGECGSNDALAMLRTQSRLLVYSGFPDVPDGYDELLLRTMATLGAVKSYRRFGNISRAAIVDLREPTATNPVAFTETHVDPGYRHPPPQGCVTIARARRW